MQIPSVTRDGIAIVSPAGVIDTRTAQAFEVCLVTAFGEGTRSFAIDFGRVDLITSAGIRVLVMMAQRAQRGGGGLALFALGERVRTVLEIGGLLQRFRIVATEAEAVAMLSEARPAAPAPAARALSELTTVLLDLMNEETGPPASSPAGAPSKLTAAVLQLVGDAAAASAPDEPGAGQP